MRYLKEILVLEFCLILLIKSGDKDDKMKQKEEKDKRK